MKIWKIQGGGVTRLRPTNKIDPVVTYNDAGAEMKSIRMDTRGKSGVYLCLCSSLRPGDGKTTNKVMVGSSVGLHQE